LILAKACSQPGILATVVTSGHDDARTRLAALGGAGLILLDAAMLVAVWLAAPRSFAHGLGHPRQPRPNQLDHTDPATHPRSIAPFR
jgi:hypothetical protein